MSLLLLDVNALLALGWEEHLHHAAVIHRLHDQQRWATCAIVQLGFIRLAGLPGIFHQPLAPQRAAKDLLDLVSDPLHQYIDVSPAPVSLDWRHGLGPKQSTDRYLLAVAEAAQAQLLTLDRGLGELGGERVELLR